MVDPDRLGWNDRRASEMPPGEDLVPARVAVEHRGAYDLLGMGDDLAEGARVSADLRDRASGRLDFPAVGDWVAVRPGAGPRGADLIEAVLPRTSLFVRRAPGRDPRPQVVGTNIDTVFIATSLDGDLNPRRLERYLAVVHGGDAEPVVLVTKTDLVSEGRELDRARALVASVAPGVEVVPTSVTTGEGLDRLVELIPEGRTAALVGSSGVGKSTIVNAMMGREVQQVAPTRADGRGRHTTVTRDLLLLPGGGLVVDTPGMREVQLWEGTGLDLVFPEIAARARECRFADCRHISEPGCEVRAAVERGEIAAERLAGRHRLEEELEELRGELEERGR